MVMLQLKHDILDNTMQSTKAIQLLNFCSFQVFSAFMMINKFKCITSLGYSDSLTAANIA